MNETRFDDVAKRARPLVPERIGRRGAIALGMAMALLPLPSRGRKKQRLRRNEFGCVPVGKPCRGKDGACCSGICLGKKPKPGKKDRSRCVGHDASTCQAGSSPLGCGGSDVFCATTAGQDGVCATTTGNAGFCADDDLSTICAECDTDRYCQAVSGNPSAACVRCASCATGKACARASEGGLTRSDGHA